MRTVIHSVPVAARAVDVWRVLTTRDLVREWAVAFADGIDIKTTWRKGAAVSWRAASPDMERHGVITELEPERRLSFHYPDDPPGPSTVSYVIRANGLATELHVTVGPLIDSEFERLNPAMLVALDQIASLAEESATIRRRKR